MSRKERAKAYAEEVVRNALWTDIEYQTDETLAISDVMKAYLQGAKDADKFPAWRKCEEELPKEQGDYLVADSTSLVWISSWIEDDWTSDGVIAWLPIPQFNHKER